MFNIVIYGDVTNYTFYIGTLKQITFRELILSSNRLTGTLPASLAELSNLKDFRISDNNLSGSIPNFIENWRQLNKLELIGTGLSGPIPSSISFLNLTDA
uniref:Putative leucine-rich repeat domain, L domain-like protein n=1 Tax=Helianthus annuus TaxID=4232 RepID=A0A251T5M8_HELAN